jgi:O-antigen/teichoic acid export membrane protein
MSSLKTLSKNIFSNWVGYAIHAAIGLLLTPYLLSCLGESRFGVWALVTGVTGYYGLLDAGFRVGITRFLTRYRATGDYEKMNRTASTGFVALVICAFGLTLTTLAISLTFQNIFRIERELHTEVFWAILIVGMSTAGQFIFFVYSAVFAATQRYEVSNAIGVTTRLLTVALTVFFLNLGFGLIGVCSAAALANLTDYMIRWRVAKSLLPELSIRLGMSNWASAWEFLHFSVWNMATDASRQIIYNTDAIIIGIFLAPSSIANYALAVTICNQILQLFKPMGAVFFPFFAELDAKGDKVAIQVVYLNGTKFLVSLALVVGTIGFVWADDFYQLWIGDRATSDTEFKVSTIFRLIIFSTVLAASQRVGAQLLIAMGRIKLRALLIIGEALLNLALSVGLIPYFGLVGVAVGTLIPAVLFQGIVQPLVLSRQLEINPGKFLWHAYSGGLGMLAVFVPTCIAIRALLPVSNLLSLMSSGILALIAAAIYSYVIVLSRTDRARFNQFSAARIGRLTGAIYRV